MIEQGDSRGPELTAAQKELAGFLFDTKTNAPVGRRRTLPHGDFEFYKIERPTSPIDFAQEDEFALKLHETKPEAPLSPVYVNLRNLPEHIVDQVGRVMAEIESDVSPDVCAGIPKAGVPLAIAYSKHSGIEAADIFEKEQTGEVRRIVAGHIDKQKKKLRIIDDLATQGHTKLEAISAAEEMGYEVVDIVVLVDRQQGAKDELKQLGYDLHSAFTLDQLLRFGLRTRRITEERYRETRDYLGLK